MAEVMLSAEEACYLHGGLMGAVEALEERGLSRADIGTAMIGVGLALLQVHLGSKRAIEIMTSAQNAMLRQAAH